MDRFAAPGRRTEKEGVVILSCRFELELRSS